MPAQDEFEAYDEWTPDTDFDQPAIDTPGDSPGRADHIVQRRETPDDTAPSFDTADDWQAADDEFMDYDEADYPAEAVDWPQSQAADDGDTIAGDITPPSSTDRPASPIQRAEEPSPTADSTPGDVSDSGYDAPLSQEWGDDFSDTPDFVQRNAEDEASNWDTEYDVYSDMSGDDSPASTPGETPVQRSADDRYEAEWITDYGQPRAERRPDAPHQAGDSSEADSPPADIHRNMDTSGQPTPDHRTCGGFRATRHVAPTS
jgi:hypothetical protein